MIVADKETPLVAVCVAQREKSSGGKGHHTVGQQFWLNGFIRFAQFLFVIERTVSLSLASSEDTSPSAELNLLKVCR